jgi:hypothetical protein
MIFFLSKNCRIQPHCDVSIEKRASQALTCTYVLRNWSGKTETAHGRMEQRGTISFTLRSLSANFARNSSTWGQQDPYLVREVSKNRRNASVREHQLVNVSTLGNLMNYQIEYQHAVESTAPVGVRFQLRLQYVSRFAASQSVPAMRFE